MSVAMYFVGLQFNVLGYSEPDRPVTAEARPIVIDDDTVRRNPQFEHVILFGDLHVHTTYSTDAFLWSLPLNKGAGARPPADACDYARFCSALDFWGLTDHAEATTPYKWQTAVDSVRACQAQSPMEDPDLITFMGWEWTQVAGSSDDHFGHRNVHLKSLDDIPARPVASGGAAISALRVAAARNVNPRMPLLQWSSTQRSHNFIKFLSDLGPVPFCTQHTPLTEGGCLETADTPKELFDALDRHQLDAIVIPHGTTWGFYTPTGYDIRKSLADGNHNPKYETLVEIMSGHGNSEEYRPFRAVNLTDETVACPAPTPGFTPACWLAGDLIEARCLADGSFTTGECSRRKRVARALHASAGIGGHLTVTGEDPSEWLDTDQCQDCFMPSLNYRPGGSVQYMLANVGPEGERYRIGFVASSDTHDSSPGTGYKVTNIFATTESGGAATQAIADTTTARLGEDRPLPYSIGTTVDSIQRLGLLALERERQASFFTTGGLAGVHATERSRDAIWEAMKERRTYGTSGPRMLLWFDAVDSAGTISPMGSVLRTLERPTLRVRALGALKQAPGCPDYATNALGPDRVEALCHGECYNPTSEREKLLRIEIVRIRPPRADSGQAHEMDTELYRHAGHAGLMRNKNAIIEDPWYVHECDQGDTQEACLVELEDREFSFFSRTGQDVLYYARAIQEETPRINGGLLRCDRDDQGNCIRTRPCLLTGQNNGEDCVAPVQERAWSSPIFVDAVFRG